MFRLDDKFDVNFLRVQCEGARSRIYGFILYTRKDAYVIKFLKDFDFCNSLHELSGPNWPIFYINPTQRRREENCFTGTMNYMTSYSFEDFYTRDSTREIFNYFGLDSNSDAPCFVTFIWGDDNQLRSFVISIDGSSEESVFKNLSAIVSSITDAESHILEEYKSTDRVFLQVKSNLEALKFKYKVQKFVNKAVPFVEFFSNFR